MIRALYDKGEDYIDSFWPFALNILPTNKSQLPLEHIQTGIKKKYDLDIPQYSLSIILTRAKRKHFLFQKEQKYALTNKGLKYLEVLETEREADRRINEFIDDAKLFLQEKYRLTFSRNEIKDLIQAFIKEHIEFFKQFTCPESATAEWGTRDKLLQTNESALLNYFTEVERSKPTIFKTLQDVVCGSIISAILNSKSFAEPTKKFERTSVYLDTNFVFSILNLDFDEFNKPALELFNLMKSESSFELRVFDFTVNEMVSVLRNYAKEQYLYIPSIKVSSIFSSLKAKGWTSATVIEFIVKIEEKLWALEIAIEPTSVELPRYNPKKSEYRSALLQYKPEQHELGQNHDLAAIEKIIELRKKPVRRIESAKSFFLTSDIRLAKYDFLEMGHKEQATICEVIPDRLLTNLLWLKNPALMREIPLGTIIAMHSRHLFINKELWKKFYETVETLQNKKTINDKDISILLYDKHIQEILGTYSPEEVSKIDASWVLNNIENAKKRIDKTKEEELVKQKAIFEQKITQIEQEKNNRLIQKLSEIKKTIETEAEKVAKRWFNGLIIIVFFILMLVLIQIIPLFLRKWVTIEPMVWLLAFALSLITSLLGIRLDPGQLRNRLKRWLFNKIYRKKLQNSKLEELENHILKGYEK
jgi:hypothetical protein